MRPRPPIRPTVKKISSSCLGAQAGGVEKDTHILSACLAPSSCLPGYRNTGEKPFPRKRVPLQTPGLGSAVGPQRLLLAGDRGPAKAWEGEGCAHSPHSTPLVPLCPSRLSHLALQVPGRKASHLSSAVLSSRRPSQGLAHSRWCVNGFRVKECDFSCPACVNCGC